MNEFTPIELTQKLLLEVISPEEKKELDSWINSDLKNKELFEEYKKVWNISLDYQKDYTPDVDAGLKRFQQRIAKDTKNLPTSKVRSLTTWYRVAAAVFLLVGAGFVWNYFSASTPQMAKVTTSENESKVVTLSDGSTVSLNENSTLSYPVTFDGDTRSITFSGEAFIKVTKDPEHPFIVQGNQTEVKVLGTSFNIRSYPEEKQTEVVVATGKVQFSGKTKEQQYKFVVLEKDDQGIYEQSSKKLLKTKVKSRNHDSWNTKKLHFEDTPMSVVIQDIENYYNIKINKSKAKVLGCKYTSTFNDNSISEVFENLELALDLKVQLKEDKSYELIGGRNCN